MNKDQWIDFISESYDLCGKRFTTEKKNFLFVPVTGDLTQEQKENIREAMKILTEVFFKKVINGESFGNIGRIKEQFGMTLKERYGASSGPYINLAQTYWTYKIEMGDLVPEHINLLFFQILDEVDVQLASIFFPTPGPLSVPINERREAQRKVLEEYAPGFDVERFLKEYEEVNSPKKGI